MARATSPFQTQEFGQPGSGEWQELRGELVALLDQVETQVARTARPEPTYQGLAERMRDLRHQVTEAEPDTRHREALRSVQRAIDKFSDRDEPVAPVNPRDTLESAIQQIRSRHFGGAAAAPQPQPQMPPPQLPPQPVPQFDELAEAVGGISTRLERLEGELRVQAKGQTANVREIAEQVGQLSHVVELLAGAVGETGQVKRLEAHIAGLAKLIAEGPKVDMTALTQRLDDVSMTVGKLAELQKHYSERFDSSGMNARLDDVSATVATLAELQKHYADRSDVSGMTARLDDVSATVGRLADLQVQYVNRVENPKDGLKDAMGAIENGVRNIYDRVDAIERAMAMPPAELEKITEELGRLAQAVRQPQQPQGLIELIDALNVRISDIEDRSAEVGELKLDMEALRDTVMGALEPRFAALEQQIEVLSDKVTERPADMSIGQLEAQVRQLVARMDQTGEQLTGLAKLYAPAPAEAPDFDQLAELVAARTSDAIRKLDKPTKTGLDEAGYAEIEKRVSQAMKAAAKEKPAEETIALDATIREVNDRLKRLEASLEARAEAPAPAPVAPASFATLPEAPAPKAKPAEAAAAPAPSVSAPVDPIAPLLANLSFEDELPSRPQPVELGDSMPSDPIADAPLVDKPFGDPNPLHSALEAKNGPRKRHVEPTGERPPAPIPSLEITEARVKPPFDPSLAERPPQPKSSLDLPAEEVFVANPAPEAPSAAPADDEPPMPNRNTFIEAHRRAARQAAASKAEPISAAGGSLIGKAFARFQATRAEAAAVTLPVKPTVDKPTPVKAEKLARSKAPKAARPETPTDEAPKAGLPFGLFKAKAPRQLAGDKEPVSRWQPEEPAPRAVPAAPEPSLVALGAEETSPSADEAGAKPQSFLLRHKRPILLAASVVALACLTINLINQRLKPSEADAPAPAAETAQDVGDAALAPVPLAEQGFEARTGAPRVIPTLDKLTTASIGNPAPQKFVASAEAPKMPQAFEAATDLATAAPAGGAAQSSVGVASLSDKVEPLPDSMESPVKFDRPPATLGPEPLLAAAANGDARAQFEVASIYMEGRAVPEDLKAAAIWYERAAGQGFAPAQYRLGNLYENGRGVDKDLAQARLWYQQAAEAGNRMAMHNLAALYAGGGLGTQQFDAAAKWFEEAASRGMKDSQFNLGMLYARGLGVKQDLAASFKWFSLAANKGDKDAAKSRDDIAASLDAATVQKMTAEVAAFEPQPIDFVANFAPIGTWSDKFDPGAPITTIKVVKGVQLALHQLGFDVGTPDGVAGPKTAEAIRTFERSTGMSESGAINPRLLAVLGSQPV
jgi:localization factor PodJL